MTSETNGRPSNKSVAVQLWIMASLIPIVLILLQPGLDSDFSHFWFAGHRVLTGHAADVYTPLPGGMTIPYPPVALPYFVPFAVFPRDVGAMFWLVANLAFFYWAARPYMPAGLPKILAILTPAALVCGKFGQTGFLLGGFWLLAFRGRWWAVALLIFKPHLGALSAFSLKTRFDLIKCVLAAIAIVLISFALFGPSLWGGFFARAQEQAGAVWSGRMWQGAGTTPAIAYGIWGWIPFALAGSILLLRRIDVFTTATASFLISPYGFHYDMTVVSLGFGLIAYRDWDELSVGRRIAVAAGFMSPILVFCGSWLVPPVILWALWVQTSISPEADRNSATTTSCPVESQGSRG